MSYFGNVYRFYQQHSKITISNMSQKKTSYRIYPSIGVARLGNGPAKKDQVIFSPEVPMANLYETDNNYLTEEGKIKKQAQRFYIYECEDGKPVKQIDPKDFKKIEWHAEVANKKPFWYDFNNSLDLSIVSTNKNVSPDFAKNNLAPGIGAAQRNPNVLDMGVRVPGGYNYRKELVNRPAKVSVSATKSSLTIIGKFPFPFDEEIQKEFVAHLKSQISEKVALASKKLKAKDAEKEVGEQLKSVLGKMKDKSMLADSIHTDAKVVPLGTIEYDNGTLIFYAADGISASLNPSDLNTDFADNSNWYDDICDGRITATITTKDGDIIELNDNHSAAWVFTAPPDYAPQIQPISSMYDMIVGAANDDFEPNPNKVYELFYKFYRMQWVNAGDFLAPSFRETIDKLIEEDKFKYLFIYDEQAKAVREMIFDLFRNPAYPYDNEPIIPSSSTTNITNRGSGREPIKFPSYPGDGINYPGSPAQWFAIPPILYEQLESWKNGFPPVKAGKKNKATNNDLGLDFGNSKNENAVFNMDTIGRAIQNIYLMQAKEPGNMPYLMNQAVLDTLYGGGFHPGVELTWPMRHNLIYAENSLAGKNGQREIRMNGATPAEQEAIFFNDFGFQMVSNDIAESMGVVKTSINNSGDQKVDKTWLWKITPGDLTKWMGIPWQSDAGSCQHVFIEKQYPVPAWWAANLPVDVLYKDSYEKLLDDSILPETKRYIYGNRLPWLSTTDTGFVGYHAEGGYMNGLIAMVYQWKKIGMVTGRKIENPAPGIPPIVYVAFNGIEKGIIEPKNLNKKLNKLNKLKDGE